MNFWMNWWQKSGGLKLEDTQAVGLRGVYDLTADQIAQNFMQVPADCALLTVGACWMRNSAWLCVFIWDSERSAAAVSFSAGNSLLLCFVCLSTK